MPSFRVHAALGIGVGAGIALVTQDPLVVPVAVAASLAPDVDIAGSYASRCVLIPIWLFSHHRDAWHSLAAAIAAGFAGFWRSYPTRWHARILMTCPHVLIGTPASTPVALQTEAAVPVLAGARYS